ncbi:Potassium transporter [Rhynchospora pubera]|uniref:Potassium transporter n=1 Tax=Rhynchospora pubera TaxID=906938 RepID=A0AAV8C9E6_9POAL|nr:Potassium transporter [Rhynchospora pubera]
MYSLICRYSNVNALPNQQTEVMEELSAYKLKLPDRHLRRAEKIRDALERSSFAKTALLSLALLGTCMVIGDGILTPCISVLSAVDGVKKFDSALSKDAIAMISIAILVALFSIQRFGTDKVGYTFAPAILVWYIFIGSVGIYNLIRHDSTVLKAFNPIYIVSYFRSDLKKAWISLGGVVLCMTGMLFSLHILCICN